MARVAESRLSMKVETWFYIEPGLPHEVFNCSETDWVHAIVARSDASEWQNIEPYDRDSE